MAAQPQKPSQTPLHQAARRPETTANHAAAAKQSEVDSKQLFADAKELFIRHEGERYTLRRTSKGKLILTK